MSVFKIKSIIHRKLLRILSLGLFFCLALGVVELLSNMLLSQNKGHKTCLLPMLLPGDRSRKQIYPDLFNTVIESGDSYFPWCLFHSSLRRIFREGNLSVGESSVRLTSLSLLAYISWLLYWKYCLHVLQNI